MAPPELLERDHLIDDLDRRLEEAAGGRGSLVFVSGEAGAGKTALVRTWAEGIGRGARVLVGGCDPLTTPRPLSPLLDIAADPDAGLSDLLTEGAEPLRLFGALLDRLRGSTRPTVVVVEDVHWADDATLDLLRFLGRRVGDARAVVLCTFRDDGLGPEHPLRLVMGDLAARRTTRRLRVEPLSVGAVATLADDREHDPERLHRVTGGNAFYVTEVLAAGEEVPTSVHNAVLARVGRIGDSARRVVEAVSAAPRHLEIDHALALAAAEVADVDEAITAGVLVGEGGTLRFRHDLARAAVEESVPAGRRLELHRRMLDLLRDEGSSDLARLAHHAVRAQADELIVAYAPEAARQAATRGAHREAVRFYRLAIERPDHLDPDGLAELRLGLAAELEALDDPSGAAAEREAVVAHHRDTGDPLHLGRSLVTMARSYWYTGHRDDAGAALDEALGLLRPLGPSEDLARALWYVGYYNVLHRRREPALEHGEAARRMAGEVGAERLAAQALHVLGAAELTTGGVERGTELVRRSIRRLEELHEETRALVALFDLGLFGCEVRAYDVATDALRRAERAGLRTDHDLLVTLSRAALARIAFEEGRWDEAASAAADVAREARGRTPIGPATALGVTGRIRVRRGGRGAREVLEEAVRAGEGWFVKEQWPALCGLAELEWLEGRLERVPEVLGWMYEEVLACDSPWGRGEVAFWLWRAGALDQPPENVAEPFALHIAGDWAGASAAWRDLGCPYEEALALADGDPDAMLAGLEILDRLGARPAASWLRSRLRDVGVDAVPRGPRPNTRAHPAGLTPRQAEVLDLVVEGHSNGEIADRLFISKRTVEHHVSAIFAKLGVNTRAQAIAAAAQLEDGGTPTPT